MRYDTLLELIDKNSQLPSKEIIAFILVNTEPKFLTFKEISFREHIWYMFQYECEIHNHFNNGCLYWENKFLELIENRQIDKKKFLEETLLTTLRFTNRSIPNYFFRVLNNVELSNEELLQIQDSLFMVLQSQHSKPINQTLKYLKRICKEPSFNIEGFQEQIPLLLNWNVKAVVNSTLSLIDSLIKAYPAHKEELALLVVQTLAQEDETLQLKAVKLLAKHKLLTIPTILSEIDTYTVGLYHSTKKLLPNLKEECIQEKKVEVVTLQHIREDNRIPTYESFEELVFFFSQVFEQNNIYDFDLFIELLPKLNLLINKDNVNMLSPAFNRAYKSYIKWGSNENVDYGSILFAMISCFISYAKLLIDRFPKATKNIQQFQANLEIFFSTLKKQREELYQLIIDGKYYKYNKNNITRERHLKELEPEPYHGHYPLIDFENIKESSNILYIYHKRLQSTWEKLILNNNSICFSTPTHTPAWIDISTFILRLKKQKDISTICPIEMQIALVRVINSSNLPIKINIKNEIGDILNYLFNNYQLDINKIKTPEYWQIAILRKENIDDAKLFTKNFYPSNPKYNILNRSQWHLITKTTFHMQYNERGYFSHYKKYTYPNIIKFKHKRTLLKSPFDSLFKHLYLNKISSSDIVQSLLLYLTMPHYLIDTIEYTASTDYIYTTEPDRVKYHIKMLKLFNESWYFNNHEITYLFLVRNLIDSNKTIRTLASELWIKATQENSMNHQLLGQTLGKLEHNEYAPLKRFTDLVVANMLNLSTLHNKGLHTLLSTMISQMNDEPIKGTKKLLEIYFEVLSLTKLSVPRETLEKLELWGEVKSLKSLVKKILTQVEVVK